MPEAAAPSPAVFVATLPPWASELVRAVSSKQSNAFVLHGVPADLVPVRGPAGGGVLSLFALLVPPILAGAGAGGAALPLARRLPGAAALRGVVVDRHLQPGRGSGLRHAGGAQPIPR